MEFSIQPLEPDARRPQDQPRRRRKEHPADEEPTRQHPQRATEQHGGDEDGVGREVDVTV